ncbi:MAG: erythromycin esterase family protein [Planctomycetes bacterium]|nr:erythromycin esterase family protein [Planctomycetota bacterium]
MHALSKRLFDLSFGFVTAGCLVGLTRVSAQDDVVRALASHAIAIRVAPSAGDEFADLETLRDRLANVRCVAIGEALHGDGITMRAKIRLVRFLHERCGFDVLAFESGLWDCEAANRALHAGTNGLDAAHLGVFGCWTRSLQCHDLWSYLAERAKTDRPLEFCGFDCQPTGRASATFAKDFGRRVATITKLDEEDVVKRVTDIARAFDADAAAPKSDVVDKALRPIEKALGAAEKDDERAFLLQALVSMRGMVDVVRNREASSASKRFNPRDEAMADNLLWLLGDRYRERKVIVWAATMHVVRKADGIQSPSTANYRGFAPMGSIVAKKLGDDYFVIGFDCGGGSTAAFPWSARFRLSLPSSGSLSALASSAALGPSWIDLRRGVPSFLEKPLVARPLGHSEMRARWTRHLDAIVYLPSMRPSRPLDGEPMSTGDPVRDFERAWKSDVSRIEAGNVYAEKGAPAAAWEDWVDLHVPGREQLDDARDRFEAWTREQPEHPSLAWRVHEMRAAIADSLGDRPGAKAAFDEAVAAYPDKSFANPASMSGFQHVINRRAAWLLLHEGLDAAIESITTPLGSDARFDYFFAAPWKRLLDPASLRRFEGAILAALDARAETFPDDARSIAAQRRALRSGR